MWEAVGIPETEAKVYEALIPSGSSTVADLARRTGFSPAQTQRALLLLADRGLVSRLATRPVKYLALEPLLAGSVLISKQEQQLGQLQSHLNGLEATYRSEVGDRPHQRIEVIEGAAQVFRAFVRVQRTARKEIRGFDKPPYFVPPGEYGDEGPNLQERQLLDERTVRYRVVYDRETVALPGRLENIWEGISRGEHARVATAVPAKLVIADATLAILSSAADYREATAYLIHPSSLLDVMAELFETTWERAVPLNQPGDSGDEAISGIDRQLLGLLASGATDVTIARSYGWSIRTVQRHVRRLMQLVGAGTRFQIGMEAVRRGWL